MRTVFTKRSIGEGSQAKNMRIDENIPYHLIIENNSRIVIVAKAATNRL